MELTSWKTWALCAGFGFLCSAIVSVGYKLGYGKAEAEGLAALNALKAETQEERRRAADAYGKAVAETLAKYREEVSRGDSLAERITAADTAHAEENAALKRRISNAAKKTAHPACAVGPDVVRLLNDAAGACLPDPALPGDVRAAGAAGGGGACEAPDLGLLEGVVSAPLAWTCEGKPNANGGKKKQSEVVSQADLLAWTLDYIARTRRLENRLEGWRELFTTRAEQGAR